MHSLLLALLTISLPTSDLQTAMCRSLAGMQNINMPPNRDLQSTDIEHASAVYYEGRTAGALYVTKAKAVWYSGGYKTFGLDPQPADLAAATNALGIPIVGTYSFRQIDPASLKALLSNGFATAACF